MDGRGDLCVTDISSVYELTTFSWNRPRPLPRFTNALAYFREGSVTYYFENETLTAHPGDILVLPKGVVYSGQRVEEKNSFYIIDFETKDPTELDRLGLKRVFSGPKGSRERFRRILECWENGDMLLCRGLIYELVHTLVLSSPMDRRVADVIALMKHRLSDPALSMAELCAGASVSESHLRRMFRQETGRSPMQYLNDLRIAQAKNMLLHGDVSVGEVAEFCGYSSLFYFSRDFKNKTGLPPSRYLEGQ